VVALAMRAAMVIMAVMMKRNDAGGEVGVH
jgi:hypothetical protein